MFVLDFKLVKSYAQGHRHKRHIIAAARDDIKGSLNVYPILM